MSEGEAVPGVPGAVDADGVIDAIPPELTGPRHVATVTTTYLEMTEPPAWTLAPAPPGVTVVRAERPSLRFYRYLYDGVGGPWHWYGRRVMPAERLRAILDDPRVAVHVLWLGGVPVGYAEFDGRVGDELELAYFGLFPESVGGGLGAWFLRWSVMEMWRASPRKLWVHTCTLDHPAALPLYRKVGFVETGSEQHRQWLLDTPPG